MTSRRSFVVGAGSAIVTPYFFSSSIVKAQTDALTEGIIQAVNVTTDNLSMIPAGASNGEDRQVRGGGVVYGRTVQEQAELMSREGRFVVRDSGSRTGNVCSDGFGYMFVRFQTNRRNFCAPLGLVGNQNRGGPYKGAMTLLEGPNFIALSVLTNLLKERNYSADQMKNLCWPISLSSPLNRERARLLFEEIIKIDGIYQDRDVLHARSAECSLRYTHINGRPDGGGEGALIVNNKTELKFEFKYNPEILRAA